MKAFKNNQRVKITVAGPLFCRTGTVVRLRMKDNGAFVAIDGDPIPDDIRLFPANDKRGNHQLFFPEDCEPS